MFKRKIYDKLLEWKKESDGHTAILMEIMGRKAYKSDYTEIHMIPAMQYLQGTAVSWT